MYVLMSGQEIFAENRIVNLNPNVTSHTLTSYCKPGFTHVRINYMHVCMCICINALLILCDLQVYTSGKGSSAAGLTASVMRDPATVSQRNHTPPVPFVLQIMM